MFSYGFAKVFPLQMPTVFLSRLLEPYGDFSPMGVIWYSIGAAPGYERFIGSAEVLGGLLLLVPWTGLLGALVTFGVTFGVFMVNMTYNVPVKLFAFHLVLMSIFLIAPDARRLINWFVLNRPVVPAAAPRYGPSASSHRGWIIALLVFTAWALASRSTAERRAQAVRRRRAEVAALRHLGRRLNVHQRRAPTTAHNRQSAIQSRGLSGTERRHSFQKMDQSFDRFSGPSTR